jgi:1,4-dihydroxy-6-naphthoate synthase
LGQCWEKRTGLPIPLGGIAVSRKLPIEIQQKIARVLRRSIQYAKAHPSDSWEYVQSHARELDTEVIRKHIELFVNDYTLDLGITGRRAVEALCKESSITLNVADLFLPL